MSRGCKVISFYFGENRRANPRTWDEGKVLIDYIYAMEQKIDPGMEVDTIIVNTATHDPIAIKYLDNLHGSSTHAGLIKVCHRENIGISFGSFNHAYEMFREEYDYWFFSEDDLITNLEGYYSQFVNQLNAKEDLAFVALVGTNPTREGEHAHNGAGCTSRYYLQKVYEANNRLPYHNAPGMPSRDVTSQQDRQQFWKQHIYKGEIPFTNCHIQMGYTVEKFSGEKPYIRWIKGKSEVLDMVEWGRGDYVNDIPEAYV